MGVCGAEWGEVRGRGKTLTCCPNLQKPVYSELAQSSPVVGREAGEEAREVLDCGKAGLMDRRERGFLL